MLRRIADLHPDVVPALIWNNGIHAVEMLNVLAHVELRRRECTPLPESVALAVPKPARGKNRRCSNCLSAADQRTTGLDRPILANHTCYEWLRFASSELANARARSGRLF